MPPFRVARAVLLFSYLLAFAAYAAEPGHPIRASVPTALDIPANYKVTASDWIENGRPKVGWPLGHSGLRGKVIKERNGVFPIHLMRVNLPQFKGFPLRKDDLVIGVNDVPLGRDGLTTLTYAVEPAIKLGKTVCVTRWRQGKIETVVLNFKRKRSIVPDLTKGGRPDKTRDWALGPIGANGWGYSQNTSHGGSTKARQLLITLVDKKGPAAGRLKVGDVILGVWGKKFEADARKVLAAAIDEAETDERKGKLELLVWRPSTARGEVPMHEMKVEIPLQVLGSYSATTPFDCPKTEKIINNAVAFMKANKGTLLKPSKKGWLNYINGLGLLATGRADVLPLVRDLAHASVLKPGETLSVDKFVTMQCWWWSYKLVFLSEYYLKTKDKAVLRTVKELAVNIAKGQSGAGTWGHTYAAKEFTGYYHGHLGGYGAINQVGLTMMIGLHLADKCGIQHKELASAIKRGNDFFGFFIGKGAIPYGDHGAAPWYDDNGKSGAAAVYFDLAGRRDGAEFFSDMVLASSPGGREIGHAGDFWAGLWGGIGAARAGDKGLQAFMKEMNYVFTLERQYDGRFVFQDNVGEAGTKGKPKSKWDCTGARLLQLCVPRRAILITGKETPRTSHLSSERLAQILRAGRLDVDRNARARLKLEEIFELLRDPLPPTRVIGARALSEREIHCVPQLMSMLDSSNRYARYGAAYALGKVGYANRAAAEKLIRLMKTEKDTEFRLNAITALTNRDKRLGLISVAKPAMPALLRMAVTPAKDDPRRVLQHDIGRALFYNGRAQPRRGLIPEYGREGIPSDALVPALREILRNKNGWARSVASEVMYPLLTKEERGMLWGDIYRAVRYIAPSGIMFATGVRTDGLALLSKYHVKEGMYLAAWYIRWQKAHGSERRIPRALAALEAYGAQAKPMIPYLQEHVAYWVAKRHGRRPGPDDTANKISATIRKIKTSTLMPKLISIADQLSKGDVPPRDGP